MTEIVCIQCQRSSDIPSNRLVQDSCGHKKCRSCLLEDVEICKQCLTILPCEENHNSNDIKSSIDLNDYDVNVTAIFDTCTSSDISNDSKEAKGESEDDVKILKEEKEALIDINMDTEIETEFDIELPDYITMNMAQTSVTYTCTICSKTFLSKSDTKLHESCAAALPFKCETCKQMFETKIQLNLHHYKHSREPKPNFCPTCRKVFTDKSKLSRHLILHSSDKKYICSQCAKAFKSRDYLKIHLLTHDAEKPFSCHVCSAKFNHSSNLKKHLVSHTDERAYMCDKCGKTFKINWALTVHKKSHSAVRPHKCNLCTKAFVNFKELQRHTLIHTKSKSYTCGICKTSFRRKDNLRRHAKNTHPGMVAEIIQNTTDLPELPETHIDNPNAINVITSVSPSSVTTVSTVMAESSQSTFLSTDASRTASSIINAPVKLAFKPPAFKNSYNIASDENVILPDNVSPSYSLADGTNSTLGSSTTSLTTSSSAICAQSRLKITPLRNPWKNNSHSSNFIIKPPPPPPSRLLGRNEISPLTYAGIRQLISTGEKGPLPAFKEQHYDLEASSIHYETSFLNRKHAMIKNIKFKVPEQYTKLFTQKLLSKNSSIITNNNCNSNTNGIHYDNFNCNNININNSSLEDPLANASLIISENEVSLI